MDRLVESCGFVLLIFSIFSSSVESNANHTCTERWLMQCQDQFNENSLPVCPEVLELQTCLEACANTKVWPSWVPKIKYESLVKKMNSYPDCIAASKVHKKECNEEFVNDCYQQFNHNATPICPQVQKLRICISELTGCHAMKHPKFVLSRDILEKHKECFFVNYSRILEVLKKKDKPDNKQTVDKPSQGGKTRQTEVTVAVVTINTTEKPAENKPEQQSGHLPYTFVVVATVCTCMFLVVLVVFSIVRHTTLSKRQRNSSIERAPMRIRIRSRNPRYRTRHHRHPHSSRGHVATHGAVRQTVSGFFEGNVAPPPYSAVLDDSESVRAGDAPPPYRPPSCVAIGVIV